MAMDHSGFFTQLIHIGTSILIILTIVTSYYYSQKFKGGLISKFFQYLIYGSIPVILWHFLQGINYFNKLTHGYELVKLIFEHFSIFFLYLMILIGSIVIYKNYKDIKKES